MSSEFAKNLFGNMTQKSNNDKPSIFGNNEQQKNLFAQSNVTNTNTNKPNPFASFAQNNNNASASGLFGNNFNNQNPNNLNLFNSKAEEKTNNPTINNQSSNNTNNFTSNNLNKPTNLFQNQTKPSDPPKNLSGSNTTNTNLFGTNNTNSNLFQKDNNNNQNLTKETKPVNEKLQSNIVTKENENKINQNLFGNQNLIKPVNSEKDKKKENENSVKIGELVDVGKLSPPNSPKKNETDYNLSALMSSSIEDLINKWKKDLDFQVSKFEQSVDTLKEFELNFQKDYNKVEILNEIIDTAIINGEENIEELNLLCLEEDRIIDQLDAIEKSADKYLNMVAKNERKEGNNDISNMIDDRIYVEARNLNDQVKQIDCDIKQIEDNIFQNSQKKIIGMDNLLNMNLKSEENQNDITEIMNSFYNGLKSLQSIAFCANSKIESITEELNELQKNE